LFSACRTRVAHRATTCQRSVDKGTATSCGAGNPRTADQTPCCMNELDCDQIASFMQCCCGAVS
jgi:hypothetical protein